MPPWRVTGDGHTARVSSTPAAPSQPWIPSRRLLIGVVVLCGAGIIGAVVLLTHVVLDVWQTSGAIAAILLAAALATGAFFPLPLTWLRVMRLFAGVVLAICAALLTLVLGYAIEHSTTSDPFLGGLGVATFMAFVVTLATDLRLQLLEARAAAEREQVARERHDELLAAFAARAEPGSPVAAGRARGGLLAWSTAALLTGWVLGSRRR